MSAIVSSKVGVTAWAGPDGSDLGLSDLRIAIDHATAIARHLWLDACGTDELADRLVEATRALHRASLAIDPSSTVGHPAVTPTIDAPAAAVRRAW